MWNKIETAFNDPEIISGTRSILVCDNRILGGFHKVVCWHDDAPMTKLGKWGWATDDGETYYHSESFTHWMDLPIPPENI